MAASAFQWFQPQVVNQLAQRWTNREGFIADSLFPKVPVPQDKFKYLLVDPDVAYRLYDDSMAPHASANEIDIKGTLTDGVITDKALKVPTDEKETDQNPGLALVQLKVSTVQDSLALGQENRAANILRATATYPAGNSTTLTGTAKWSDPASDPKAAILAAMDAMLIPGNVLWMGQAVYTALQQHPKLIQAVGTTGGAVDPRESMARYFQVDKIVVGKAFYSTNKLGQALVTARLWGTDAGLVYTNPRAPTGLMQVPTFGAWAVSTKGGASIWRTYNWIDNTRGTGQGLLWTKIEGTYDLLVQASQLGYLWKTAA